MAIGDYPVEYKPAVHGPYDPARYYGKPDTPLSQVKLNELGAWFGRRNKSPKAMVDACSRSWWRWQHKYCFAKRPTAAPYYQLLVGVMLANFLIDYGRNTAHKNAKYH